MTRRAVSWLVIGFWLVVIALTVKPMKRRDRSGETAFICLALFVLAVLAVLKVI